MYLYLGDRQGTRGESWPGINTMARDLSMSRSTVKRAIADLERFGYIEKQSAFRSNGAQSSNRYTVVR